MRLLVTGCIVSAALALTPVAALADVSGKKIAVLVPPLQQPYLASYTSAMTERAKALSLETTVFSSPYNPAVQAQQVDDAIARKFDMLVVTAVSANAIVPALKRAKDAGIPVLLAITPAKPELGDLFVSYVGANNPLMGKIAADAVVQAMRAAAAAPARSHS
jgi:ABC-type sugar transport system substrate-binding protein